MKKLRNLLVPMMSFAPVAAFGVSNASGAAGGNANDTTGSLVANILNKVVLPIFMWIGIILLAWAIGMLVLAFKNEDADSKSRAIMLIVVSVVLISLRPIMGAVLSSVSTSDESQIKLP